MTPNRREVLLGAAAAIAAPFAARASETCAASAAPQTEGPYWIDEMLNRSDLRADPSSGLIKPGLPLTLALNFHDVRANSCSPLTGAQIDIWHCDATGLYSDEDQNGTRGQKYLRGYQIADENGLVRFTTIYPGWYQGRTVHVHFRVRRKLESGGVQQFTSQMYFSDELSDEIFRNQEPYRRRRQSRDMRNSNDMVLQTASNGISLFPQMKNEGKGYSALLDVGVDFSKRASDFGGPPPGGGRGPRRGFGPPPTRPPQY